MKKIKLTEFELTKIISKVVSEQKRYMNEKKRKPKRKPVEDSKYTKWCKEHGWEDGVGQGCADDALDSEDYQMRSWAIGFITGIKEGRLSQKTITEQSDVDSEEEHDLDINTLNIKIREMSDKLNELQADYVRKIGIGDHHEQLHTL